MYSAVIGLLKGTATLAWTPRHIEAPCSDLQSSHGQSLLKIESSRKQPSRKHRELAKGLEGLPLQQKTPLLGSIQHQLLCLLPDLPRWH